MNRYTVLAVDLVAIAAFALLARLAHQKDGLELSFSGVLSTWWPFAIGVVIAFIVAMAAQWDSTKLIPAGVATWIIIVVTGLFIWYLRKDRIPHISFIIVASVSSAILLLGWRAIVRARANKA